MDCRSEDLNGAGPKSLTHFSEASSHSGIAVPAVNGGKSFAGPDQQWSNFHWQKQIHSVEGCDSWCCGIWLSAILAAFHWCLGTIDPAKMNCPNTMLYQVYFDRPDVTRRREMEGAECICVILHNI